MRGVGIVMAVVAKHREVLEYVIRRIPIYVMYLRLPVRIFAYAARPI
jgi:hypothetical protein